MAETGTRGMGIMLGIGLMLALIGLVFLSADSRLADSGVRTDGVVTGFTGAGNQSSVQVEFVAEDGARHRFDAGRNANLALSENDRVRVLYDPQDPTHAVVDSFGGRSLVPYALLTFGLLLAGLSIASIIKLRRQR